MARTDHTPTSDLPPTNDPAPDMLRVAVFVVAALGFCVAVWALMNGGDRDLFTTDDSAALGGFVVDVVRSL